MLTDEIKTRMLEDWKPLYLENGKPAGVGYSAKTKVTYRDFDQFCRAEHRKYLTKTELEQEQKERKDRILKAEADRLEKARKITLAEYDQDQYFYDDNYYLTSEIDTFIDDAWCQSLAVDIPRYVWATKLCQVLQQRDALDIFGNDLTDSDCDEIDWSDVKGAEELDAALEKFFAMNTNLRVYFPDFTTAILIESEVDEYLLNMD